MKKIKFLFLLTLLLIGNSLSAQDVAFGIKGGVNSSTIGGDSQGVTSKFGIHVGAFSRIRVSDYVVFQPELIYSMQGAAIDGNSEAKFNYNYLNVPLIFKVYPSTQGFHIHAGPQIGILLSGKFTDGNIDIKEELNPIDFALGFGLGYDFKNVIIEARFNLGLNSSAESDEEGTFPLRTTQLSVGFSF